MKGSVVFHFKDGTTGSLDGEVTLKETTDNGIEVCTLTVSFCPTEADKITNWFPFNGQHFTFYYYCTKNVDYVTINDNELRWKMRSTELCTDKLWIFGRFSWAYCTIELL